MDIRTKLEQLSLASLTEEACPSPDQLAAYVLGTLAGTEQLHVAAHVRLCPLCQEDVAFARPPEPRPRPLVARLLPSFVAGVRGTASSPLIRQYQAADLIVELTIVPPEGDYWRITGQVLRHSVGVAGLTVSLRASRRRPSEELSDDGGFFTFEDLPAGRYTLSATDGTTVVQVRGINLSHDGA